MYANVHSNALIYVCINVQGFHNIRYEREREGGKENLYERGNLRENLYIYNLSLSLFL